MSLLKELRAELKALGSPTKAATSAWFFKTGPGQYGEGDVFLGVRVPEQRKIAHTYRDLSLKDVESLLLSPVHEERLTSLFILVDQFKRGEEATRKAIYDFYITNATRVNNWDLVDSSADYIVGAWLQNNDRSILKKLAKSENLWERRIAMIATYYFIKQGDPFDAFQIAEILIHDRHDLIQKAVGWMLREIGDRCSMEAEEAFLAKHYKTMPRTMLRYAIEKFPEVRRQEYLKAKI